MKLFSLLIVSYLISFQFGFSQSDTTIYYGTNNKKVLETDAIKYVEVSELSRNKFSIDTYRRYDDEWEKSTYKQTVYVLDSSTLLMISVVENELQRVIERKYTKMGQLIYFRDYYENGNLKQEGLSSSVLPLHLEGDVRKFYKSGQLSSIENYENNQLISNKNWLENGEKYIDNIFTEIDTVPEFQGGDYELRKHIAKNTRYPSYAKENGIQGRVFVQFVVNEKGQVKGARVVAGVHPTLDAEAKRVIETIPNKWKSGKLDGRNVCVSMTIPINFQLN